MFLACFVIANRGKKLHSHTVGLTNRHACASSIPFLNCRSAIPRNILCSCMPQCWKTSGFLKSTLCAASCRRNLATILSLEPNGLQTIDSKVSCVVAFTNAMNLATVREYSCTVWSWCAEKGRFFGPPAPLIQIACRACWGHFVFPLFPTDRTNG